MRALFSLDDTTDAEIFARKLVAKGWEIIASKETVDTLRAYKIPVTPIEDFVDYHEDHGFPPTLHPKIEAALTKDVDYQIDLVYCIPYGPDKGLDVGGHTLLALAAKGKRGVVSDVETMRAFVFRRDLSWGENPYQKPCNMMPIDLSDPLAIANFEQVADDTPEYTNIADLDAILNTLCLLSAATNNKQIMIVAKHGNACGVSVGDDWANALNGNKRAVFGGEIVTNKPITENAVELLSKDYMIDVIACPQYLEMECLRKRTKLFINPALVNPQVAKNHVRFIRGGYMVQPPANYVPDNLSIDEAIAWAVAYSSFHGGNEIAIAKDNMLIGVGGGPSTVEAAITAVQRAKANGHDTNGSTFCADAFFPFEDACQVLIDAGCTSGVAPAGGKRENDIRQLFLDTGVKMRWLPEEYRGFCRH